MYKVQKEIQVGEVVIYLLDIPYNQIYNENVYSKIYGNESLNWTIEKKRSETDNSPYVNIYLSNNKLYAVNYDGWTEEIDIRNGKIITSKFTK
jgi:hypothetical protein